MFSQKERRRSTGLRWMLFIKRIVSFCRIRSGNRQTSNWRDCSSGTSPPWSSFRGPSWTRLTYSGLRWVRYHDRTIYILGTGYAHQTQIYIYDMNLTKRSRSVIYTDRYLSLTIFLPSFSMFDFLRSVGLPYLSAHGSSITRFCSRPSVSNQKGRKWQVPPDFSYIEINSSSFSVRDFSHIYFATWALTRGEKCLVEKLSIILCVPNKYPHASGDIAPGFTYTSPPRFKNDIYSATWVDYDLLSV